MNGLTGPEGPTHDIGVHPVAVGRCTGGGNRVKVVLDAADFAKAYADPMRLNRLRRARRAVHDGEWMLAVVGEGDDVVRMLLVRHYYTAWGMAGWGRRW